MSLLLPRCVEATGLMKTKGIVAIFTVVLPLFCGSSIYGADSFDSVRCDLTSKSSPWPQDVETRKLLFLKRGTKDLGLKILGLQRSQTFYR